MAQRLKPLAALPADTGLVLNTHTAGSSQPPVTPVPVDLMLSSDHHEHQACKQYTDVHAGQIPTHIK